MAGPNLTPVPSLHAVNVITSFFLCSLPSVPADASNPDSVVVSVLNISATRGSQAVLPCKSYRMVWTQDRLNDRQRVVHWDVYSTYYGDNKMERLCDMYSAGNQRVYSSYNQGRILMPQNAFTDGNFSLVIKGTKQDLSLLSLSFANVFLLRCKHLLHSINDKSSWLSMKRSTCPLFSPILDVAESDAGVYSCNLHHHYCHLYETVKIQLDITKKGRCDRVVSFSAKVSLAAEVQWSPGLELNSQWGLCADSQ